MGLPALVLAIALAWFAYSSYRRAQIAEQVAAELRDEVRALEKAVAAAEQGLRTLASHPSVPRDVVRELGSAVWWPGRPQRRIEPMPVGSGEG